MITQLPISLPVGQKTDVRTQFGALCYRIKRKKPEALLVTSRTTKRWIIPKGWPIDGKTPAQVAEIEAWEEAGVKGVSDGWCLGIFSFRKDTEDLGSLPCVAMVFAIRVMELSETYPESEERKRRWVSRKKAARRVDEPELARILRDFDPREAG